MKLESILLPNQVKSLQSLVISYKDMRDQLRAMIANDKKLAKYFVDTKPAAIANELFTEEYLKENPLYIDGDKTSLCCAIDYMRDLAKKSLGLKTRQQKSKDKQNEKENEKEQAKLKDLHQIIAEFTYIQNRIDEFDEQSISGMLAGVERLHKLLKEKQKSTKATKSK